jgi:hypothetical protein
MYLTSTTGVYKTDKQIIESKMKQTSFFALCRIICLAFLELGAVDRAVGGATAVVLGK